ncbi:CLUMA_CG019982_ isoform A [Caligus rogercresseyi]|uniref:CLUMA_CG019982_ isoform A n=1 Tax=Caligus rogercresseyi TaxID=217165 RepID=A0A7T8KHL8_CALRO|nr:CLUMA_CG019982_ isoform A [Caligus rogercresseyi]
MMLNSKIPLPQRSLSSSGLDYRASSSSSSNRATAAVAAAAPVVTMCHPLLLHLSSTYSSSSSLELGSLGLSNTGSKSRIPIPASSSSVSFTSSSASSSSSSSNSVNGSPIKKQSSGDLDPVRGGACFPRLPLADPSPREYGGTFLASSSAPNTSNNNNRVMRKYETFVMTGERMLCITKTPAKISANRSLPNNMDSVDYSPSSKIPLPRNGTEERRGGPLIHSPVKENQGFHKEEQLQEEDIIPEEETKPTFRPLVHSPVGTPKALLQEEEDYDDSISPSASPIGPAPLNDSISSSSSSSLEEEEEQVPLEEQVEPQSSTSRVMEASLRSPSMIPFNPSPSDDSDVESLHSYHPPPKIVDIPSAIRLAKRLYTLDGFRNRANEYNSVVAEEYLKFFDAPVFLSQFCLTGETQERERVLFYFSKRYRECNPDSKAKFLSIDAVHTLTCAIMLLNTDLHGDSGQRKMTSGEFIKNLAELNEGLDFPRELLKSLYYAIKHEPIPWALNTGSPEWGVEERGEEEESPKEIPIASHQQIQQPPPTTAASLPKPINLGSGVNPFLALPDPLSSTDYKKGYVMRKCCVDPNGKRTKMGRRSWKMFYLSLRDMVLYCFKDEKSLRAPGAFEDLNQPSASTTGSLCAPMTTPRSNLSSGYTPTSDEKELLTWIDAINYVVASFSSPKLPAPISSATYSRSFQRPLLPSSKSKLNPEEQLGENEGALLELRRDLDEHLLGAIIPSKGSLAAYHRDKGDYLRFEVQRYETYILTLRTKFSTSSSSSRRDEEEDPPQMLAAKSLERIF